MNLRGLPYEHDPDALLATVMALPEIPPATDQQPIITGKANGPAPRPNDDAKHLRLIAQALKARR